MATVIRMMIICVMNRRRPSTIGKVSGIANALTISTGKANLSVKLNEMIAAYHEAIPSLMSRAPSDGAPIDHVAVGSV